MKRIVSILLSAALLFSLVACGTQPAASQTGEPGAADSATPEAPILDVEKELFDVKITVPGDLFGETTQEALDADADSARFHSAVLNEDGSVTFTMSKRQHKAFLEEIEASILDAMDAMPGSEEYPNITRVEANADFTVFTVTTTSEELSLQESFSVLGFYMYGGLYHICAGEAVDNIHVDFVNADTGEILESADSSEQVSR